MPQGRAVAPGRRVAGVLRRRGGRPTSLESAVAAASEGIKALLAPPFMHGAGHWLSLRTWNLGGTVVIQDRPEHGWTRPTSGASSSGSGSASSSSSATPSPDPSLDELDRHALRPRAPSPSCCPAARRSSAHLKDELLAHLPTLVIVDGLGSSEAGGQLSHVTAGSRATTGTFPPSVGNHVLSADLDRVLEPGEDELGWLAKSGHTALGYLNDPAKTRRTYPDIDGVRYAVPGDRARVLADGRSSSTAATPSPSPPGGEKIFAEEVEAASRPTRPSTTASSLPAPASGGGRRWWRSCSSATATPPASADLLAEAGTPRRPLQAARRPFVFVDEIVRSPSRQGRLPLGGAGGRLRPRPGRQPRPKQVKAGPHGDAGRALVDDGGPRRGQRGRHRAAGHHLPVQLAPSSSTTASSGTGTRLATTVAVPARCSAAARPSSSSPALTAAVPTSQAASTTRSGAWSQLLQVEHRQRAVGQLQAGEHRVVHPEAPVAGQVGGVRPLEGREHVVDPDSSAVKRRAAG